jgi:SNF2-related domain
MAHQIDETPTGRSLFYEADFRWAWGGCKRWRAAKTEAASSQMRWASARPFRGTVSPFRAQSSIALMVSRKSDDPDCKTTLICAPLALLRQWYDEIRTKTNPPLRVYIHHSSWRGKKAKTVKDILQYDVVLTTYNMIVTASISSN